MFEGQGVQDVDQVLRALVSASRSLRLYPPASPIPRQSVDSVIEALGVFFATGDPSFNLKVGRQSFETAEGPVAQGMPGGRELADEFRERGVSALDLHPNITAKDVTGVLRLLSRPVEEIRDLGGFGAALASAGVHGIEVAEILLTVVEAPSEQEGETGHSFGGRLTLAYASEPGRFGSWLTEHATSDVPELEDNIATLVTEAGSDGLGALAESLSEAMAAQPKPTRDTLLGLAMEDGPFRVLMAETFSHQTTAEVAESVMASSYGLNMLSISKALASLPLGSLGASVLEEIHSLLLQAGRSSADIRFLDHMVETRRRAEPERALAAVDNTYSAVAAVADVKADDIAKASRAVQASATAVDSAGVRTILTMIDLQSDAARRRQGAESLLSMVPRLLSAGQLRLVDYAFTELAERADRVSTEGVFAQVVGPEALRNLVDAALSQTESRDVAERILRFVAPECGVELTAAAIARGPEGLALAHSLLGGELVELLRVTAPGAPSACLAPVVARLARDDDPRSTEAIETLMRRPDSLARTQLVAGLSAGGGPLSARLLGELVADPNDEVAAAAAHALAKSGAPDAGSIIWARLSQLDMYEADYEFAIELVGALARTPGAIAGQTLAKLASRRSLLKGSHFHEVQAAVNAAVRLRSREAVGR